MPNFTSESGRWVEMLPSLDVHDAALEESFGAMLAVAQATDMRLRLVATVGSNEEAERISTAFARVAIAAGLTAEQMSETLFFIAAAGVELDPDRWEEILEDEPFEPPLGEDEVVPVDLERCWRAGCGAEISREDEVGLCWPCREELKRL